MVHPPISKLTDTVEADETFIGGKLRIGAHATKPGERPKDRLTGVYGTFHHVGRQHLHRYLSDFDFRCNSRENTDGQRAELTLIGFAGKRLTYRTRLGLQN